MGANEGDIHFAEFVPSHGKKRQRGRGKQMGMEKIGKEIKMCLKEERGIFVCRLVLTLCVGEERLPQTMNSQKI